MAVGSGGVEALLWRNPITPGDLAGWLSPGVLQDGGTGGGGGVNWTLPPPTAFNSPGVAGQISYDSSGNFYLAYAPNLWAKFTGELVWPQAGGTVFHFNNATSSMYIPLFSGFA